MFIKLTKSGDHSYVQLVESYRNDEGKPRQRTVAARVKVVVASFIQPEEVYPLLAS